MTFNGTNIKCPGVSVLNFTSDASGGAASLKLGVSTHCTDTDAHASPAIRFLLFLTIRVRVAPLALNSHLFTLSRTYREDLHTFNVCMHAHPSTPTTHTIQRTPYNAHLTTCTLQRTPYNVHPCGVRVVGGQDFDEMHRRVVNITWSEIQPVQISNQRCVVCRHSGRKLFVVSDADQGSVRLGGKGAA